MDMWPWWVQNEAKALTLFFFFASAAAAAAVAAAAAFFWCTTVGDGEREKEGKRVKAHAIGTEGGGEREKSERE